jgi:hypothetical protein
MIPMKREISGISGWLLRKSYKWHDADCLESGQHSYRDYTPQENSKTREGPIHGRAIAPKLIALHLEATMVAIGGLGKVVVKMREVVAKPDAIALTLT